MPSISIREAYIKNKLSDDDLSKIDLPLWISQTDGMSLSHLKELIISLIVMGKDFEEAMENLSDMKKSPKLKKSGSLGFKKS